MRRAFHGVVLEEDGNFFGFNLGADYTAEHEWGIKRLEHDFEICHSPSLFGLKKRQIARVPDGLFFLEPAKLLSTIRRKLWGDFGIKLDCPLITHYIPYSYLPGIGVTFIEVGQDLSL